MNIKEINYYALDYNYFLKELSNFLEKDIYKNFPNEFIDFKPFLDKNLLTIAKDSMLAEGKRIRPLLCYWLFRNFSLENNSLVSLDIIEKNNKKLLDTVTQVAIGIEILHCASLVIDDIEDGSSERRGKVSLHLLHGMPKALNAGNWMYFLALKQFPAVSKSIAIETLFDCHIGQAFDLSSNDDFINKKYFYADENTRWSFYEKCVSLKTGKLIQLPLASLKKILNISDTDMNLINKIFNSYGIIYQIFDDLKNFIPELNKNKLYEDLNCGLRSAVVHSFIDILNEEEKELAYLEITKNNFKNFFLQHYKKIQSLEKCYYKASYLLHINSVQLETIQINRELKEYLSDIIEKPFDMIRKNIFSIIQVNYKLKMEETLSL
ncbi:polyprenyl synthetase family protein [Pigmentibacter sp. JX0631]|uniref:polyprenyl synthetase family protein n=1 Tax=Pigmentibacter sp. JX0631 TaxID=2976982 RepID=UPI0024686E42|nr:polyprenyl synthetase family protein [Pigmentibacter sp. JX0631]WGL58585.1 polyprenyl synthetase family protein [Pigmentibacter sp. JX0631]